MRDTGSLACGRDYVGRICAEDAVQDFIGRYGECDNQAYRRALVADTAGGDVELAHDVVDRLFGQLGQVPLGEVVHHAGRVVHSEKVAVPGADWNRVFPYKYG